MFAESNTGANEMYGFGSSYDVMIDINVAVSETDNGIDSIIKNAAMRYTPEQVERMESAADAIGSGAGVYKWGAVAALQQCMAGYQGALEDCMECLEMWHKLRPYY